MAIDVEWQDECGECLAQYDGRPIGSLLPESASDDSPCLRFVDPYGDTTFNEAQVKLLEEELATLAGSGKAVAEQAKSLLEFVKQISDRTHRYLKFIGD